MADTEAVVGDEPSTDHGDDENLPAYLTPKERHHAHIDAGIHPEITMDDTFAEVTRGIEHGVAIKDGDRLIGFMERNECPVCGEKGHLTVGNGYTFTLGVKNRESAEGSGWIYNDTVNELEDRGFLPIECRAGSTKYFVGYASPSACETYREWVNTESERKSFRSRVKQARGMFNPDFHYRDHSYDKGTLLAAIIEELGVYSYDTREYMGRSNVKKGQLQTILERIKRLKWRQPKEYHEDEYLILQDFSIGAGVEWDIPEWVDFEGLRYSDHYRTKVFEE